MLKFWFVFAIVTILQVTNAKPFQKVVMPRPNRCTGLTFIVHSHDRMNNLTDFMSHTNLINVNLVVMTGQDFFVNEVSIDEKRRRELKQVHDYHRELLKVTYDGNPGTLGKAFKTGNARGAHRTMAGLLIANDTFPHSKWFYVLEHDNFPFVEHICEVLSKVDDKIPLLLGEVGPKNTHAPCRETSDAQHWSCCTSLTKPCTANLADTKGVQSHFVYDAGKKSMVASPCVELDDRGKPPAGEMQPNECCQTVPWPSGMEHGFRYRLRHPYEEKDVKRHHAIQTPHSVVMYPHGSSTYAISKGMMNTIGRPKWEKMTYALQCHQADVNVMVAILNSGYSITHFDEFKAMHHVHDVDKIVEIALTESTTPPVAQIVKDAICSYPPGAGRVRKFAAQCAKLCPTCDTESDVDVVKYCEGQGKCVLPTRIDDRDGVWYYAGSEKDAVPPSRGRTLVEEVTEWLGWKQYLPTL